MMCHILNNILVVLFAMFLRMQLKQKDKQNFKMKTLYLC